MAAPSRNGMNLNQGPDLEGCISPAAIVILLAPALCSFVTAGGAGRRVPQRTSRYAEEPNLWEQVVWSAAEKLGDARAAVVGGAEPVEVGDAARTAEEWPVVDWPPELAGHPWGFRTWPCVPLEEVEEYKQADGSICLLVHATGLEENR
ncbi:hypothetical protein AK812_SmicGene38947 [Symbiodinium microadriaticum]|uniref:Uncharacterized protein n=1 Tax=Symbiodinium microadriaticum TaxID=2951 RepID=A0A1Q9CCG0_SYMMI|nr:hypothetical protein AK812_SmicGene38947 [Symbiodinium microadriaticum]